MDCLSIAVWSFLELRFCVLCALSSQMIGVKIMWRKAISNGVLFAYKRCGTAKHSCFKLRPMCLGRHYVRVCEFPYNDWNLRPISDWPMGYLLKGAAVWRATFWRVRPFILSSGRCLCHGSHPNAVESLGVFRNNFCIVKNLDFVLKYSVYSAIWYRF